MQNEIDIKMLFYSKIQILYVKCKAKLTYSYSNQLVQFRKSSIMKQVTSKQNVYTYITVISHHVFHVFIFFSRLKFYKEITKYFTELPADTPTRRLLS